MAKIQYRFDPTDLTYKKIKKSSKKKFLRIFGYIAFLFTVGYIFTNIFTSYYQTPEEKELIRKNQELKAKYQLLQNNIAEVDHKLEAIEQRDDYLYRPIFELDPISSSIREAGTGGVSQYENLKKIGNSEVIVNTAQELDQVSKKLYIQSKSFDSVTKLAKNKEKMLACIPAIQPISLNDFRRISDYYGSRRDPFNGKIRMHYGMDFTGPVGTDIYATGDGKVVRAEYNPHGYGNEVIIDHGFGFKTVYAHLKKITVKKGQKVKRGDVIGKLGNTGRSTGPHLHYEVRRHNRPVDPIKYYFNDISAEEYDKMIAVSSRNRRPMD
jgi:murein DD-endopeptidase MepM/ murein hydrolase activator NlpD